MAARKDKARRRRGDGSCYKRKDNRGWTAQTLLNGQRVSKVFRIEKEGLAWLREMAVERERRTLAVEAHKATVADLFSRWLTAVAPMLAPNTLTTYTSLVKNHILPDLGAIKLSQLGTDHLDVWYAEKGKVLAPSTVKTLHSVVHNALARGTDAWQWLPRNVARGAIVPAVPKVERRAWTAAEARRFLDAVAADRLSALWTLALYTGLREGELCGLRWSDLDLSTRPFGQVSVLRQVQRERGKGKQVRELKTGGSQRRVLIPMAVVGVLLDWYDRQRQELPAVHVFTTEAGALLEPSNIRKRFAVLRRRLPLPYIRFHDLRHTAASLLLDAGVPPKTVAEMLGHSSIKQTFDTYGHLFASSQEQAAKVMERLLEK